MKANKFLVLIAVVALVFTAGISFAAVAVQTSSWTDSDVIEFNGHNPSAVKTYTGQRLKGLFQTGAATVAACAAPFATNCHDADKTVTSASVNITTGATSGQSHTLNDGFANQEVTYLLVTDGGQDFILSFDTKTGLSTVTLDDAGDGITMKYIDDTVGWMPSGNVAATINQ